MKKETVFREKSIERISSPDQLNDYIRLADPGVWFILSAIIIILAGGCVFGIFGHIDSTVPAVGIARDGKMECLIKKEYGERFTDSMTVRINESEYDVSLKDTAPVTVPEKTDPYTLMLGDLKAGEWVYEAEVECDVKDGSYEVTLITDRISPLSFLFGDQ